MAASSAISLLRINSAKILQVVAVFVAGLVLTISGALFHAREQAAKEPVQTVREAAPQQQTPPSKPVDISPPTPLDQQALENSIPAAPVVTQYPAAAARSRDRGETTLSTWTTAPDLHPVMNPPAVANPPKSEAVQASDAQAVPELKTQVLQQSPNSSASEPPQVASASFPVVTQPSTPEEKPTVLTLPAGTILEVHLAQTLSSDRNRAGDTFRATLTSPLIVNGSVFAHEGATVLGRITSARKAPLIGGRSELTLTLTHITASDERLIPVDTSIVEERGSNTSVVNTAKMATGAVVGAVVGAVRGAGEGSGLSSSLAADNTTNGFMATKRTVVLRAGARFVFRLDAPLTFKTP